MPNITNRLYDIFRFILKKKSARLLTIKIRHFGQHHPGCGDPQPVVQLEGAGCQFDGITGVVVMGAMWVGVGQGRVLACEGSCGVGVHGMAVESLCGDPCGTLRM